MLPTADYPLDYKEACFYAWYKAGRPRNNFLRYLPTAPDGRKPNILTIKKWMRGGEGFQDWEEHADDLDYQLTQRLDKEAIEERARLVKQLAKESRQVKLKALEYLAGEEPFKDNPSAAVRAFVVGQEGEFKYSGMAASLLAISEMSPKQLEKEALRLLGKNENADEIIEVDSTDLEEIPSDDDDSSPEDD